MHDKVNSRNDLHQEENTVKETIQEKLKSQKESRWDRLKRGLKYLPIIGTSIGIGFITAASMGIALGAAAAIGTGLAMSSGVIIKTGIVDSNVKTREDIKWDEARKVFSDNNFKIDYNQKNNKEKLEILKKFNNKILGLPLTNKKARLRIDKFNELSVKEWFDNYHKDLRELIRQKLGNMKQPAVISIATGITTDGFIKHIVAVEGKENEDVRKIIQDEFGIDNIITVAYIPNFEDRKFTVPQLDMMPRENHGEVLSFEEWMRANNIASKSKLFLTTDKYMCVTCQITGELFKILNLKEGKKILIEVYEDAKRDPSAHFTDSLPENRNGHSYTYDDFKGDYEQWFIDNNIQNYEPILKRLWEKYKYGNVRYLANPIRFLNQIKN